MRNREWRLSSLSFKHVPTSGPPIRGFFYWVLHRYFYGVCRDYFHAGPRSFWRHWRLRRRFERKTPGPGGLVSRMAIWL